MNARKLYTNAYRIQRNKETMHLIDAIRLAHELGLIEDPRAAHKVIAAASISYVNRNNTDPYETWMDDTCERVTTNRVLGPIVAPFVEAIMPIANKLAEVAANWKTFHDKP